MPLVVCFYFIISSVVFLISFQFSYFSIACFLHRETTAMFLLSRFTFEDSSLNFDFGFSRGGEFLGQCLLE